MSLLRALPRPPLRLWLLHLSPRTCPLLTLAAFTRLLTMRWPCSPRTTPSTSAPYVPNHAAIPASPQRLISLLYLTSAFASTHVALCCFTLFWFPVQLTQLAHAAFTSGALPIGDQTVQVAVPDRPARPLHLTTVAPAQVVAMVRRKLSHYTAVSLTSTQHSIVPRCLSPLSCCHISCTHSLISRLHLALLTLCFVTSARTERWPVRAGCSAAGPRAGPHRILRR
mgnify:CR=1 FL=1